MTLGEKLLILIAIPISLFGLLMLAGGTANLFESDEIRSIPAELTFLFFLGVLPLLGGAWLFLFVVKRSRTRKQELREREMLILAAQRDGKLTEAEVTMHLKVNSSEAGKMLATAHRNGLAEIEVTEGGVIVYHFRGILTKEEKETAEGV